MVQPIKKTTWIPFYIYSLKLCICFLFCSAFPGEHTLTTRLLLTGNTNNSLTSLPSPKQFMTTMIISQTAVLESQSNQRGLLWNVFTQVSVCIILSGYWSVNRFNSFDCDSHNKTRSVWRWRWIFSSGIVWLSDCWNVLQCKWEAPYCGGVGLTLQTL